MNLEAWRPYSAEERRQQIAELAMLCRELALALHEHGDPWAAAMFSERSDLAERLLSEGWDQQALNDLGAQFPDGVDWMNPKAVDYGAPREPWQDEFADVHARARLRALEVRSVATKR